MVFLALFLASKFSIWFSLLPLSGSTGDAYSRRRTDSRQVVYRDEGAAPPNWLLFLVLIPLGIAIYITGTRFFDYYHFGFDLITGSLVGILTAWFSFRWYNLPLGRSAGWAWGPRSRDRAFGIGVGTHGWVADGELPSSGTTPNKQPEQRPADLEMGNMGIGGTQGQLRNGWGPQRPDEYHQVGSGESDAGRAS